MLCFEQRALVHTWLGLRSSFPTTTSRPGAVRLRSPLTAANSLSSFAFAFAFAFGACGSDTGTAQPGLMAGTAAPTGIAGTTGAAGQTAGPSGTGAAGMTTVGAVGGGAAGRVAGGAADGGAAGRGPSGMGGRSGTAGGGTGVAVAGTGASGMSGGMAGMPAAGGGAAGTGTAGMGSGGGAAPGGWSPCPATGECKILPLGDSITVSLGFAGSYRVHLFELAVMNMKKITFVGSLQNGPAMVAGMPFPKKYEAVSGITIMGIDGHIPSPGLNDLPHIVLIHIGTNDMYMSPAGAPDRLGTLIDGIIAGAPDALIVVAQIIPLGSASAAVKTYNDAIPGVVKKRADAGKHVIVADLFTGFPTSELVDGVHPGEAGCSRMADKWWGAISSYLH